MIIPLIAAVIAARLLSPLSPLGGAEHGPERAYDDSLDVVITAPSAAVIDEKSGATLYARNADERRPIGSITKLMTAQVFLDTKPSWDSVVTMTAADRQAAGTPHIKTGERATIRDVFAAALIASDNDAAAALSRLSGLPRADFVRAMNRRAAELGMTATLFSDPTGLDEKNMSTARDVITLLQAALRYPEIAELTQRAGYTFEVTGATGATRMARVYTTNALVGGAYPVLGGKTGYIDASRYCLVVKTTSPDGHELYAAVLGSASMEDRFTDMKSLITWVTNNYHWNS